MIKKFILIKIFVFFLILFSAISCSSDNSAEENFTSEKKDVTASEAKSFLNAYTSAKSEDKELLVSNFSKKNKIDVNESETITAAALDTYSPEQMAAIIPTPGGAQPGELRTDDMAGTLFYRRVEWKVAENPFGMWRIKSFEDVVHNMFQVLQVSHFGTRFEGLTFGVISWEEFNSAGNVRIVGTQNQILSQVQGTLHVTGWYDTPIDNYCIFTIYP